MSVIALAIACFPVLAQADSSELQYEPQIPSATGEHPATHHQQPSAKSSNSDGGASAPNPGSRSSNKGAVKEGSSTTGGGGKVNGGTGQRSQASSPKGNGNAPVQPNNQASGLPVSHQSDGGSSPLVPILVLIAVLAAVSLGAVLYRQRRQRSGSQPISPKAS